MASTITYDVPTNIMAIDDYPEGGKCDYSDLWDADKVGTLQILAPKTSSFGYEVIGGNPDIESGDRKFACRFQLTTARKVKRIFVRFSAFSGTIKAKAGIYSDSSGAPNALLGTSAEVTVADVASWCEFEFSSSISLSAGYYWLAIIIDGTAIYIYDTGVSNQEADNSDTYADGFSDPFGTPSYNAHKLSMFANFTFTLDEQVRPADSKGMKLNITITNYSAVIVLTKLLLTGTDIDGNAQTESITITGNGDYTSTKWFASIDADGVDCEGIYTIEINQARWGVIWKTGDNQFRIDCKLQIGEGVNATWFKDTEKQITFTSATGDIIEILHNGHFTLGNLKDAENKIGEKGCSIRVTQTGNKYLIDRRYGATVAELNLYASTFSATGSMIWIRAVDVKIYDCTFLNGVQPAYSTNFDMKQVLYIGGNSYPYGIQGVIDRVSILSANRYLLVAAGTLSNVYGRGYVGDVAVRVYYPSSDIYLINADLDAWTLSWQNAGSYKVYRQYSFNLKVTELDGTAINGATVTLKDKNDAEVFSVSTAADGTITEQTVSRGYYDEAHGDTIQDYSPHKLIIEKAGFQTYEIQGITMEKTDWIVKLAKAVRVFFDQASMLASPVINLKKTDPENKNVLVL